jgi:hypothetical protein
VPERPEPDLDDVREAMREHDERAAENEAAERDEDGETEPERQNDDD